MCREANEQCMFTGKSYYNKSVAGIDSFYQFKNILNEKFLFKNPAIIRKQAPVSIVITCFFYLQWLQ